MKKTLLFILLLLTVCLLSSCFPTAIPSETTPSDGTTTGSGTGYTPPLEDIRAALISAAPTESHLQISTTYNHPEVTLVTDITLLVLGEDAYYTYRAEYLRTVEEALATGEAIGAYEGYLRLAGTTVTAQSGEVDAALLAELENVHVRMPDLRADFLASHTVTTAGDGYALTATVKDTAIPLLFDGSATGSDMEIEILLDADLRPTALTLSYRAEDGAAVTYTATYGYRADIVFP